MSTAIIPKAHPVPSHTLRNLAVGAVLLAAASVGMYQGAQAVTRHYSAPTSNVSYATTDTIARTLAGAWHTPAKLGAFRADADISGANVVSVVVAVP